MNTTAIKISAESPLSADAQVLLSALSATLQSITGSGGTASFDPADIEHQRARFFIARDARGTPVGCGAFRPLSNDIAEIKRMYAMPGTPGIGSALLSHIENEARLLNYTSLYLETRVINQRAVNFYFKHGYQQIENYGKYVGNKDAICFGKVLT